MTRRFPDEMSPEELSLYLRAAKEALRKRLAALRRTLPAEARAARADAACAAVLSCPAFVEAKVILAYAPLRFELDPAAIVARAHALGKQVALPRVAEEGGASAPGTIALHAYHAGDALAESSLGIREPLPEAEMIAPETVDLVLVPGLAFDGQGFRLGYGKGFYDRLLPNLTLAVRIGLCFELSLLPEIPREKHDEPVHGVATERRLLWVPNAEQSVETLRRPCRESPL